MPLEERWRMYTGDRVYFICTQCHPFLVFMTSDANTLCAGLTILSFYLLGQGEVVCNCQINTSTHRKRFLASNSLHTQNKARSEENKQEERVWEGILRFISFTVIEIIYRSEGVYYTFRGFFRVTGKLRKRESYRWSVCALVIESGGW